MTAPTADPWEALAPVLAELGVDGQDPGARDELLRWARARAEALVAQAGGDADLAALVEAGTPTRGTAGGPPPPPPSYGTVRATTPDAQPAPADEGEHDDDILFGDDEVDVPLDLDEADDEGAAAPHEAAAAARPAAEDTEVTLRPAPDADGHEGGDGDEDEEIMELDDVELLDDDDLELVEE